MEIDLSKIDEAVNALHREIQSLDVKDSLSDYIQDMLDGEDDADYDDAVRTLMISLVETVLNKMMVK